MKNAEELVLQMMERGGMLLTVADDDPTACFVVDDYESTLNGSGSVVEVSRPIFDSLTNSGKLKKANIEDGEWWEFGG